MRFTKMPDEAVDLSSAAGGGFQKNAMFSVNSGNSSASDMSDGDDDHATRLAELQEQVGAEQVGLRADVFLNQRLFSHQGRVCR